MSTKLKTLIRGPILTTSGYGVFARVVLDSLLTQPEKFDVHVDPTVWGNCSWLWQDDEKRQIIDDLVLKHVKLFNETKGQPQYDLSLQVTIPNEWEKMARVNIGVCAGIETTKVAGIWLEKANMMDKVIVTSEFAKNNFVNTVYDAAVPGTGEKFKYKLIKPIEVIGCPVQHVNQKPLDLDFKSDFNFLTVCQWGPRKNVDSLIRWFVEEFIDQNVGLVLKTFMMNNSLIDKEQVEKRLKNLLREYPERKCQVYLLHGDFTDEEMYSLYNHPKIKSFVTIPHAEGYCLPMLEAASCELPVICPEWSGYLDFMTLQDGNKLKSAFAKVDYDLNFVQKEAVWQGVIEADSMWAYPKQGSFKMRLREVYKDYSRFKSQAKKLALQIKSTLTPENIAKQYCDSFAEAVNQPTLQQKLEF